MKEQQCQMERTAAYLNNFSTKTGLIFLILLQK